MKNKYRLLGLVACLFVVWMVARGTNGCGFTELPPPDAEATLEIDGDASSTGEPLQADADIYGSGKLGKLDGNGNAEGANAIKFKWYTFLNQDSLEGTLTIISTKGNKDKHMHVPYKVLNNGQVQVLDIKKMKMTK